MIAFGSCGGGRPAPQPISNTQEVEVAEAETVVGSSKKSENEIAREQAIEQARAAGILGKESGAVPPATGTTTAAPAGPLDKDAIRREFRAHMRAITLCYEQRLLEDGTLQGTTHVTFSIAADGTVTTAAASGFDTQVDECVVEVVKRMVFPAPDGGGVVKVNYPLIFKQGS